MKRIVLFSTLTETNHETVLRHIFLTDIRNKVFSYMPSSGIKGAEQYIEEWRNISRQYGAQFNIIDNSARSSEEQRKLLLSNILVISGGNTFTLLHNLQKSGLDQTIGEFTRKSDFVLAGFSAGAIVLTPSIDVCSLPDSDENLVELEDFSGLGVVEVFPHYNERLQKATLESYRKTTDNSVREITNEDYISIDF